MLLSIYTCKYIPLPSREKLNLEKQEVGCEEAWTWLNKLTVLALNLWVLLPRDSQLHPTKTVCSIFLNINLVNPIVIHILIFLFTFTCFRDLFDNQIDYLPEPIFNSLDSLQHLWVTMYYLQVPNPATWNSISVSSLNWPAIYLTH
jgi:hypothetical protein